MFNLLKQHKIVLSLSSGIIVVVFFVTMFTFLKKSSVHHIVETHDFICPEMPGFTFNYPVFKGWEPTGTKSTGQSECTIFLSDENLKANHVSTEVAPQIKVTQLHYAGVLGEMQSPNYLKNKNAIGLHFGKTDTGYDFWTGDSVVHIELLAVIDSYGFSSKKFFEIVAESFRLTIGTNDNSNIAKFRVAKSTQTKKNTFSKND